MPEPIQDPLSRDYLLKKYLNKIEQDKENAATANFVGGLSEAAQQFGAGLGGVQYKGSTFKPIDITEPDPLKLAQLTAVKEKSTSEKLTEQENDPNSIQSKKARDFAAPILSKAGVQMPPDATAAELKSMKTDAFKIIASKQQANTNAIAQQEKDAAKAEKLALKQEELFIPDLNSHAKTADDAKKAKDSIESFKNMTGGLARLTALRNEFGAESWDRAAVSEAGSIATDLTIELKNLAKLGVMSDKDAILLGREVPKDPLQLDVFANTPAKLQTLEDTVVRKIQNFLTTRGVGNQDQVGQLIRSHAPAYVERQIAAELKKNEGKLIAGPAGSGPKPVKEMSLEELRKEAGQ